MKNSKGLMFYRYDGYNGLHVNKFISIRETPCGAWIIPVQAISYSQAGKDKHKRFVYTNAKASFAYTTKAKARDSYMARKRREILILRQRLAYAQHGLQQASQGLFDEKAVYGDPDESTIFSLEI